MRKNPFLYIGALLCALIFTLTACQSEEEPLPGIDMPVVITIPAESRETRVPGDPGNGIEYPLPKYARIYMVTNLTGGGQQVVASDETLNPSAWTLVTEGNYYRYNSSLRIQTPQNIAGGRVFVVLSQQKVIVNNNNPTTLEQVQNLNFDMGANAGLSLKDLYANPVNDADNTQNGTLVKEGNQLRTMVRCYHVAAKVDVIWNINPDKQTTHRMLNLQLTGLPTTGYFFYPTTLQTAGTGQKTVLGPEGTPVTPANQWFGRAVTYVLQRQNGTLDWNVTYTTSADGSETTTKRATSQPATDDVSSAFTAWYRLNARIGYQTPDVP